jgi:putative cardiolipin synthase
MDRMAQMGLWANMRIRPNWRAARQDRSSRFHDRGDPNLSPSAFQRATRAALALLLALLAGCASLPPPPQKSESHAYADTAGTRIGQVTQPLATKHPGLSGARPLIDAREAFVARYVMALGAQRSIDVQTYIWHADTSGSLLAQALWDAAERGVRVRVLLDDANTAGLDPMIAALDAHPNIEVRLFNPFANRSWRIGDFAFDFSRVNRRMHNKSFTVDNQATVVGGRNIGDEYLGAETPVAFADLDVLAIGPVVPEVSSEFDRYWNSESAWPASSLLPPAAPTAADDVKQYWARQRARPESERFLDAVKRLPILNQMVDGTLALEWVPARVVADDPRKVLQPPDRTETHLLPHLESIFGHPQHELALISPYFVPGQAATGSLVDMANRGVNVQVLTNSLAATDVGPVYSGYVRYREQLLRGGVRVYELKPAAKPPRSREDDDDELQPRGIVGSHGGGSSSASLHAKTFAADRDRVFVGSFNLDPRSAALNTEMGVVLESRVLAAQLSDAFREAIPREAYEVRLVAGKTVWIEKTPMGEVTYESTPGVGAVRSLWVGFLSLLSIEWLL